MLQVVWSIARTTRTFKTTKMKRPRKVPIHPTLAAILAEWKLSGWARHMGRAPGPDDLMLPGPGGRPWSVLTALKRFYKDLDLLGIRRRHVHCARRTFVSRCRDAGGRGEILRWITHGPSKKEMVDGYSSLAWETFCTEVAKLKVERRRSQVLFIAQATGTHGGARAAADSTEGSVTDSVTTVDEPGGIPGEVGCRGRGLNPSATRAIRGIPREFVGSAPPNPTDGDRTQPRSVTAVTLPEGGGGQADLSVAGGLHLVEAQLYLWADRVTLADGELADESAQDGAP